MDGKTKVAVVLGAFALGLLFVFAGIGTAAPSGSADLGIAKTDSPDPVGLGSTLTYSIRVENRGPDAATGVTVSDRLPQGVDLVSAVASAGQCGSKGKKVTCELGSLGSPGVSYGSVAVTIVVVPRRLGTIVNTASVKGDQKDPVAANGIATATTRVVGLQAACRGVPATIVGTRADNTLVGTGDRDVIAAFGGNDTVVSLGGRDLVCAGAGNDYVGAGSAADRVFGGIGSDRLRGRGGPDLLSGNVGSDGLFGNRGDDRLLGGRNSDRCRGGSGADLLRGCERQ